MIKKLLLPTVLLLCFAVTACQNEAPQDVDTTEPYEQYGEEVSTEGAVPVQAVAAESDEYVGQPVKLEGTIQEVCQARGCWFSFQTEDETTVRVSIIEEEGTPVFTLPTDASGRRAIVQGTLSKEEAAEGAAPRLVVTATGVLLERA